MGIIQDVNFPLRLMFYVLYIVCFSVKWQMWYILSFYVYMILYNNAPARVARCISIEDQFGIDF